MKKEIYRIVFKTPFAICLANLLAAVAVFVIEPFGLLVTVLIGICFVVPIYGTPQWLPIKLRYPYYRWKLRNESQLSRILRTGRVYNEKTGREEHIQGGWHTDPTPAVIAAVC